MSEPCSMNEIEKIHEHLGHKMKKISLIEGLFTVEYIIYKYIWRALDGKMETAEWSNLA
jgi:hypothetical protein